MNECLRCSHGTLYPDGATRCDIPGELSQGQLLVGACPKFHPGHGSIFEWSQYTGEPPKKRVRRK